ncbi:unnamed protein product, partial [Scytosiphon promiscuus]
EPEVTCNTSWVNDGECDSRNNNADCGYDGGDCCECTCVNARCGDFLFNCLDPE